MSSRGTPPPSCYQKALDLLAVRAHFRRQLATKLSRRGYPDAEVEATLDTLRERGLIDDQATASSFVAERMRGGALGRRRLAADLLRRGAEEEVIEAALAEMPEDDTGPASALAARWLARSSRTQGPSRDAALARHLERRGFSSRAIVAVLERLREGSAGSDPVVEESLAPER